MVIGVLDIQGSVREHFNVLRSLHVEVLLVKENFEGLDGLIIPGGESTTISTLLKLGGLDKKIRDFVGRDGIVYGTCAGVIILQKLGFLDVCVERNAYGSQLHSFETEISVPVLGKKPVHAVFIRAPKITKTGDGVKVLAKYKSDPVLVQKGNILASTFHPELTQDTRIHEYFLKMVRGN